MRRNSIYLVFGALCLWVGLAFSYWEVFSYSYIDYDDPEYLLNHSLTEFSILSLEFWKTPFTTSTVNLWHPLTVLSHQVLLRLTDNWWVHHLVNVLLHGAIGSILMVMLFKLSGSVRAALVCTLCFAWHPVTVESVAWLSARKDLLCAIFLLSCILCHVRWKSSQKGAYYLSSLAFGVLSMMCKPIGFLAPAILILVEMLTSKEIRFQKPSRKWVLQQIVWLIPCCFTVILTLFMQSKGTQNVDDTRGLILRLMDCFWVVQKAVASVIAPFWLHLGYENPTEPAIVTLLLIMVFAAVFIVMLPIYFKRAPAVFIGVTLFLVCLIPTSGLIRAGDHLAADRYFYLPLLGVSLALLYFAKSSKALSVALAACACTLLILQKRQVATWESLESLATHTLTIAPSNSTAHAQMAFIRYEEGDFDQALVHVDKTLLMTPTHVGGNLLKATIAMKRDDWGTAEKHYEATLSLRGQDLAVVRQYAYSLLNQKKYDQGIRYLKRARILSKTSETRDEIDREIQLALDQVH